LITVPCLFFVRFIDKTVTEVYKASLQALRQLDLVVSDDDIDYLYKFFDSDWFRDFFSNPQEKRDHLMMMFWTVHGLVDEIIWPLYIFLIIGLLRQKMKHVVPTSALN